jgi:hypothetical protein
MWFGGGVACDPEAEWGAAGRADRSCGREGRSGRGCHGRGVAGLPADGGGTQEAGLPADGGGTQEAGLPADGGWTQEAGLPADGGWTQEAGLQMAGGAANGHGAVGRVPLGAAAAPIGAERRAAAPPVKDADRLLLTTPHRGGLSRSLRCSWRPPISPLPSRLTTPENAKAFPSALGVFLPLLRMGLTSCSDMCTAY